MNPDFHHTPQESESPRRSGGSSGHERIPDTMSELVRAASADDPDARNEIARLYRGPVMVWLSGHGCPADLAEDLTQEFLAALVNEKTGFIRQYDPGKSRLRCYLKVAARNLLCSHRTKMNAIKRGGRAVHLPLTIAERLEGDLRDAGESPAGSGLDFAWAKSLYAAVCDKLEGDWMADPRRGRVYEAFRPLLLEPGAIPDYAALAGEAQLPAAALRVQFSRLKRKFFMLWTREVRHLVTDPAEVLEESQYLLGLLIRRPLENSAAAFRSG